MSPTLYFSQEKNQFCEQIWRKPAHLQHPSLQSSLHLLHSWIWWWWLHVTLPLPWDQTTPFPWYSSFPFHLLLPSPAALSSPCTLPWPFFLNATARTSLPFPWFIFSEFCYTCQVLRPVSHASKWVTTRSIS